MSSGRFVMQPPQWYEAITFQIAAPWPGGWICVQQFLDPEKAFQYSAELADPHRLEWVSRKITSVETHWHNGEFLGTIERGKLTNWGILVEKHTV